MTDDQFEKVVKDILKRFGDGSIMQMNDAGIQVETISTGSMALDLALGGGVPKGRIVEIFGPESSGKSTLCLSVVAKAQKEGLRCAYIDMEHALDPDYAKVVGVDTSDLWLSQPDTGENALEICETLIRSGLVGVVVVDSVAALVPQKELEGEMGDSVMGLQARLMSQAMRKLSGAIHDTKTVLIFTNQLRQKIGIVYGNPEVTTGGNALKFYASQRLDIRRIQSIKNGNDVIGARSRVKVVKNKVAPPYRQAEFDILYNEGISRLSEILDMGPELGVITKKGSFYYYEDTKLGQGKDNARDVLKQQPYLREEIEGKLVQALTGAGVDFLKVGISGDEDGNN